MLFLNYVMKMNLRSLNQIEQSREFKRLAIKIVISQIKVTAGN